MLKDPRRPLVNNAVTGIFPPGSTLSFRPLQVLTLKVIGPEQIVETPGRLCVV